ncbi:hypothetical protein PilKf_01710 [Pillotina sp. SPG140]|jgi:hypothetical protein
MKERNMGGINGMEMRLEEISAMWESMKEFHELYITIQRPRQEVCPLQVPYD